MIFLLLRDVVPEFFLNDAGEDRPYPAAGASCPERRRDEVSQVGFAVGKPICLNGLAVERAKTWELAEVFRKDVPDCGVLKWSIDPRCSAAKAGFIVYLLVRVSTLKSTFS